VRSLHGFLRFLRREAVILGVAILLPIFFQAQVLDAYIVSTPSMEPTIEGDPDRGDRVLVDKLWDDYGRPKRFDLCVFRHDGKTVVKRIAGLPDEWLQIDDYDLFAGPQRQSMRRVCKSLAGDQDLLICFWDSGRDPAGFASRRWTKKPGRIQSKKEDCVLLPSPKGNDPRKEEPWALRWNGRITTGYLDGFDRLQEGRILARDFGLILSLDAEPGAVLAIRWRYLDSVWSLRWEAAGAVGLRRVRDRLGRGPRDVARWDDGPSFDDGRTHDLSFAYLDGRFCIAIDGKDLGNLAVDPSDLQDIRRQGRNTNGLDLANTGGGRIRISALRVFHDIHYLDLGDFAGLEPLHIPVGKIFVLGDNSEDSQDSRFFGPIPTESLIGRPLLVAAPLSRFRWLRQR